jgi:hypothetical protein
MKAQTVAQLIPVLQTAIAPVILISGVGLLLLSMTNRLGRIIDRARILAAQLQSLQPDSRSGVQAQLSILWKRAQLTRTAITFASMSVLSAAILISVIFFTALWQIEWPWLISGMFILCMLCLIASMIFFIRDISQALAALRLELGEG